jgi:hypothetical protein
MVIVDVELDIIKDQIDVALRHLEQKEYKMAEGAMLALKGALEEYERFKKAENDGEEKVPE